MEDGRSLEEVRLGNEERIHVEDSHGNCKQTDSRGGICMVWLLLRRIEALLSKTPSFRTNIL